MNQNLEALIENHSEIMADQMVKAAEWGRIRRRCSSWSVTH